MTREPAQLLHSPVERSEEFFKATEQTLDAHEQVVDACRDTLEAQQMMVRAWLTVIAGEQPGSRHRSLDQSTNAERRMQSVDRKRAEYKVEERLRALERRQDALERKVERLLEATED